LERLTFAAWGQLDIAACIRGACLLDTEHGCPASGHELQFSSMMMMVMVISPSLQGNRQHWMEWNHKFGHV